MPSGNYTTFRKRPKGQVSDKTLMRIKFAIRHEMSNLGLTDAEIATQIGIKPASYARLKKLPIYKKLRLELVTGIFTNTDEFIKDNNSKGRAILDQALPTALNNLLTIALDKSDRKLQLAASLELLDRHGRFAKVTRTGNALPEQGGAAQEADNELANELINALKGKP